MVAAKTEGPRIPTVDLHNHISGAIAPQTAQNIAARKGLTLPDSIFTRTRDGALRYRFETFDDFNAIFRALNPLLTSPRDYYEVVRDYLDIAAKENCLLCEFMVSPVSLSRLVDPEDDADEPTMFDPVRYKDHLDAIRQAAEEARDQYGIEVRLSATSIRHYGPELAEQGARFLAANPDPLMTSYGLAGTERNHWMEDFSPAFSVAREAGLKLRSHAGELRGPASVRAAVEELGAEIIDHGIRSIEDPALLQELVARDVLFTICLTSNRLLMPQYRDDKFGRHPVRHLYNAGLALNFAPDDPGIFHTTAGQEQKLAQEAFGFTDSELYDCALASIDHAAIDRPTADRLIGRAIAEMPPQIAATMINMAGDTGRNPAIRKRVQRWIEHPDFPLDPGPLPPPDGADPEPPRSASDLAFIAALPQGPS